MEMEVGKYKFENLLVKGCVFSIYSTMGPEAILGYPLPVDTSVQIPNLSQHTTIFDQRNYMQVAIKSISLLLTDYDFENKNNSYLENIHIFGVLPYPDINCVGLTYFFYYFSQMMDEYIPASLTLFVHENHRSFIYDAINRLKTPIQNFSQKLVFICQKYNITSELEAQMFWVENIPSFVEFFHIVENIQAKPISPITQKRRIKILFTGLENTGKTSYLLTIKREFSSLPSLLPTTEPVKDSLDFLGTTIVKWDIPGKKEIRDEILDKSDRYLFETDVLYYFIDVQNPRLDESMHFLKRIHNHLEQSGKNIPIIFILSKIDEDISNSVQILKNISVIKEQFSQIIGNHPFTFFNTSIFSSYSVLNSFSYGIRQLSPNRPLLEHLLKEFLRKFDMKTGLIVNENGIVLASQDYIEPSEIPGLSHSQIFEIAAPQFTTIAKQFIQFETGQSQNTMIYQLSQTDIVLLKRFTLFDFTFFALFYTKSLEKKEEIEKSFQKFKEHISNLLTIYIT